MKIIFSELKKWLPDLTVNPKQLRDDITMIGHFASGYEEIDNETILDIEIRQNRADCLGYYGVARDLSVFYQIDLIIPKIKNLKFSQDKLDIAIESADVHRIQATRLSNIKNTLSPDWLKKFLSLHDINSINTLVDLTNYVMLQWGIPCHAFDTAKTGPDLTWEKNSYQYNDFTTLDGTPLKLPFGTLLISSKDAGAVSLSFIGGKNSGIELSTQETIIEMAVYNRTRVRHDSRTLKTITEASIRLDKGLDTETIPLAFSHLISLIQEYCSGTINSELFDSYPLKPEKLSIEFDYSLPSTYSGIDIPISFAKKSLVSLGCVIASETKQSALITPPSIRKDITITEDLTEEVIRFYGYNKIPIDSPISNNPETDITPKILYLIESLKDNLVSLGYDEVRSWPLVQKEIDSNSIHTQNSINSEYPVLRQSITQSLQNQVDQYNRYKLVSQKFFEVGKIFYKDGDKFVEKYSLGIYNHDPEQLRRDSINAVSTEKDIKLIGNFAEIILDDLPKPESYSPKIINNNAVELTSQIITLDANVNFDSPQDTQKLIEKYSNLIDKNILWSIDITDIYQNRYTFRVCYYNTDDKTAKEIHLQTFDLLDTSLRAKE